MNTEDFSRKLQEDGYLIIENDICSEHAATIIRDEFSMWLKNINFNDQFGSSIISGAQYVPFPLMASLSSIDIILNPITIEILLKTFSEKPILTGSRFQKKILPSKTGLLPHKDKRESIVFINYLTPPSIKTGATTIYKRSHLFDHNTSNMNVKVKDADYYDDSSLKSFNVINVDGLKAGTTLIYWGKIIHSVPPFIKSGREVLISGFIPESLFKASRRYHIISTETLNHLNKDQLSTLGYDPEHITNQYFAEPNYQNKIQNNQKDKSKKVYNFSLPKRVFWVIRFFLINLMSHIKHLT